MWSEDFKEGFVWRIDCAVLHRDADAEADVETMAQVNVAQFAAFYRQSVGLRCLEARLHHIPAQFLAESWRKVARRRYVRVRLRRRLGH